MTPSASFRRETCSHSRRRPGGRLARAGWLLAGAAALALCSVALCFRSGAERGPGWEVPAPGTRAPLEPAAAERQTSVPLELRGREAFGPDDAPSAREAALRVEVLDARGKPASGVPLTCGVVSRADPELFVARLRTRTDASGSAWIELSALAPATAFPADRPSEPLRLRAEILVEPPAEVVLDPGHPVEHIVLRLPPTGSVRLQATDALGRAAAMPVRFGVWARLAGAPKDIEPLPRWLAAANGVAVLEHVGLGVELRVTAAPEGNEARPARITADGPRSPGEERTVLVPLGARWPTVRVRALDERGDPLPHELLGVELAWDRPGERSTWRAGGSPARRVRTDAEGRLRFPLQGTVAGGYTRRIVLTHRDASADGVLRSAERDLSWDAASGDEIDLGDVELRPRERETDAVAWVSGSVTDQSGCTVPGATVLVSAVDADGAAVPGPSALVRVEPDGRFAVAGPPVGRGLSVRAVAPGFLPSPAGIFLPGARDVAIRMRAAARWAGRLRLDADVSPESLVVEVIAPDASHRTIPSSERIVLDGLEPGRVDVEVRTRAGNWLVERRENLATSPAGRPGAAPGDEIELDLRGRLTHLRLRLAGPDGKALDRVLARIEPEPWPAGEAWIRTGRLELLVPAATGAITLRPRGYAPISVELRAAIQELACGPRLLACEPTPGAR